MLKTKWEVDAQFDKKIKKQKSLREIQTKRNRISDTKQGER
jgi:hypothetical protein